MGPTIGAVVVTYNGSPWLEQQLRSIIAQSRPPDEIIISDDASSDDTLAIARRTTTGIGADVRLLEAQERTGITANVERAIHAGSTDVVVLADQDDVWSPNKLRYIDQWARGSKAGGWFSDGDVIDGGGRSTGRGLWQRVGFTPSLQRLWETDALGVLLKLPVVTGATLAFRREHIPLLLPLPPSGWHDYSISLLLAATSGLDKCEAPMISYRLHGANAAGLPAVSHLERVKSLSERRFWLQRQLAHFEEVAQRVEARGGSEKAIMRLRAKADLLQRRASLRRTRSFRLFDVLPALTAGDYHRYGQGLSSAARDLFWR